MSWRDELRDLVASVQPDELPELVGELARHSAMAELQARNGKPPGVPRAYTAVQVAELLNRDVSWVQRHRDRLGAIKADGAVLYPEVGLRRFLEGRR